MFIDLFDPRSAYSYSLDIAAQVRNHVLGPRKRLFSVNHPGQLPKLGWNIFIELLPQRLQKYRLEALREAPGREYVFPLNRNECTGRIEIAAEHEDMNMGEIQEFRVPSMQDGHEPDLSMDPLIARPECGQGLPDRLHQLVVEDRLSSSSDMMEFRGYREDHVKIGHVGEPLFRFLDPFLGAAMVAFGASPIAAGAPFRFDEAARRTSLFEDAVFFGAALFEVEQCLLVTGWHIRAILG